MSLGECGRAERKSMKAAAAVSGAVELCVGGQSWVDSAADILTVNTKLSSEHGKQFSRLVH